MAAASKPEVGAPKPASNKRGSPDSSPQDSAAAAAATSESASKPEAESAQQEATAAQAAEQEQQQDSTSNKQQQQQPEDTRLTNLIVNYLPQCMSQEEIRSLFSSIGEVESCKLIRDKSTINQSLGYGFVNYVKPEDAQRAIKSFNGLRLQNKTIKVSYARPSSESIKGANLYVSGLPKSLTQLELEQLFKPYGKIITSRILCDNLTGISKGVGFVRFDQRFEAERAIVHLNNTYVQVQTGGLVTVTRQPAQQQQQQKQPLPAGPSSANQSPTPTPGEACAGAGSGGSCSSTNTTTTTTTTTTAAAATTSATPAPIIVKFANSPSSNPQKQMAAAAAAAASSATSSGTPAAAAPTPGQQHHVLASLHPAAVLAAHHQHHSITGGAPLQHQHRPGAPQQAPPPTSAAVSAYLEASSANVAAAGLQAAAVAAAGNSRARFANQHQHQPGPIYHYPATNRFRYSPMASELALATSSMLNPFANHSQLEASHLANLAQSAGALTAAGGRIPASLAAMANNKSSSAAALAAAAAAACSSGAGDANFIDSSTLNQHAHRLTASGHLQPACGWCLFVYNLVPEVEESVIWKLFGPFGAVQQVNLVKDAQTNKCKGFAFVTMSDYNQALMAIQSLNGFTLANRVLQVSFKAASKMKKTLQ